MAEIQSASSAFWAPIQQRIEQKHQDQLNLQAQQRQGYQSLIQDPNTSDDIKNWAWGEYNKTLHPQVRKQFGAIQPLVQKIFGVYNNQPGQQPGGPVSPPPGPVIDTAAAQKRALNYQQQQSDIAQQREEAIARIKANAGGTRRNLQYKLPDGSVVSVQQSSKTGQYFNPQSGEPYELPEGAEPYKPVQPGTRRQYHYLIGGKDTTVFQDSKTQQMYDIFGKPYTLPPDAQPIDEEAKVAAIRGSYYGTGELNTLTKVMKDKYHVDDDTAAQMAADRIDEESRRKIENIGAQRTREQPMVVNGQVQAVPLQSGPVPRPLPPTTIPTPAPSGPAPQIPPALSAPGVPSLSNPGATVHPTPQLNTAPGAAQVQPVPNAPVPAPRPTAIPNAVPGATPARQPLAQGGGGGRPLPGVPVGSYRLAQQDARAILDASIPIFGDPSQPGLSSLKDYSDLARDPKSVERIANATKLLAVLGDQDLPDAHASVGTGGVNLGLGPLTQMIMNRTGATQSAAQSQAKLALDALRSMTPREREYYNALLSARESIVGLRKATSGGGAKYQVEAMSNTLPVIGQNVVDEAGYRDLLKRQAGLFTGASRGQLKTALSPEQQRGFDYLANLNNGPVAAPQPPLVKSKAEFDKLPKGTVYREEDGKTYRKP